MELKKKKRYIILKIVEQIHEVDFGNGLPLGIFECLCFGLWMRATDEQESHLTNACERNSF